MIIGSDESILSPSWQWVDRIVGKVHAEDLRVHHLKEVSIHDLPFGLEKMTQAAVKAFAASSNPETSRFKKVISYMNFKLISLASVAAYTAFLVMTAVLSAVTCPFYKTSPHRRLQLYVRLLGVYTFDAMRKLPLVFEVEALVRSLIDRRKIDEQRSVFPQSCASIQPKKENEDWLQNRMSLRFNIDPWTALQSQVIFNQAKDEKDDIQLSDE